MTELLLLAVLDGLAYAALVFMVAVGLTLIFGVLRVLNVAHGSFYAIGAYTATSLVIGLGAAGWSPYLAYPALIISAVLVGALLGGLIETVLLRRVYVKEEVLTLLVTFAVFMILEDVQRLVWGVSPMFADAPLSLLGTLAVGQVYYTAYQLLLLPAAAVVVLVALRWFLRSTLQGRLIVAVAHDREAAMAMGINAKRVYMTTFMIGATLAALGGALASPTTSLTPGIGTDMIVLSFAVVATAGLGQVEGAAVTAVLLGLGRSFAVYLYPEMQVLMPYLIMVVVLLFRPQGLFGVAEMRKV
ncbi:branched-chain amino acid ABC transporter permease [Azospirillum sp.]|uniref:branched-chain amino acid ABC transporter permease n=1 Tax=Azospirillum sp. TaxID=34012 RepID=UPI002D40BDE2|nr:branched-chain amino acid ABC transporter permease [Azospirillum sp.]HYD68545.1 branched-chain amino acid ABC transporter permease [Azospirillum sp.]